MRSRLNTLHGPANCCSPGWLHYAPEQLEKWVNILCRSVVVNPAHYTSLRCSPCYHKRNARDIPGQAQWVQSHSDLCRKCILRELGPPMQQYKEAHTFNIYVSILKHPQPTEKRNAVPYNKDGSSPVLLGRTSGRVKQSIFPIVTQELNVSCLVDKQLYCSQAVCWPFPSSITVDFVLSTVKLDTCVFESKKENSDPMRSQLAWASRE